MIKLIIIVIIIIITIFTTNIIIVTLIIILISLTIITILFICLFREGPRRQHQNVSDQPSAGNQSECQNRVPNLVAGRGKSEA